MSISLVAGQESMLHKDLFNPLDGLQVNQARMNASPFFRRFIEKPLNSSMAQKTASRAFKIGQE